MRSSRNAGPGRTTLQLGASPMPSMNAVARATVEGRQIEHAPMRHHPHEFRNVQILGAARGQQLRESALAATYVPAPFRRIKYL